MCGRYFIDQENMAEDLKRIIDEVNRRGNTVPVKTQGEIFPTDTVPVVANSRALKPAAFAMRWGYRLPGGKTIINARSETAADKPLFGDGMARRRCLAPASYYFEWERRPGARIKYAIRPADGDTLYMAGIYRIVDGEAEFSILTRDPAPDIAFIHNRMPVILRGDAMKAWLNAALCAQDVLRVALTGVEYSRA